MVLVVVLAGTGWLLVTWAIRSPGAFLRWIAFVLLMVGIGLLSARFRRVREVVDAFFAGYWRLLGWMAAVIGPVLIARVLSDGVAASPFVIASVVLLIWLLLFCIALRPLLSERGREKLWASLSRFGRLAPFVYALVLAELAIVLFATIGFLLADREVIQFGADQSVAPIFAGPVGLLDFFAWHMIDSIPGLGITETLRWEEPIRYEDPWVGLLLLVFKVVAIAPVVAGFASFWRFHRNTPRRPTTVTGTTDSGSADLSP